MCGTFLCYFHVTWKQDPIHLSLTLSWRWAGWGVQPVQLLLAFFFGTGNKEWRDTFIQTFEIWQILRIFIFIHIYIYIYDVISWFCEVIKMELWASRAMWLWIQLTSYLHNPFPSLFRKSLLTVHKANILKISSLWKYEWISLVVIPHPISKPSNLSCLLPPGGKN